MEGRLSEATGPACARLAAIGPRASEKRASIPAAPFCSCGRDSSRPCSRSRGCGAGMAAGGEKKGGILSDAP